MQYVWQGYLHTSAHLAWEATTLSPLHGWLLNSPIVVTQKKCIFFKTLGDNCLRNKQDMEDMKVHQHATFDPHLL